MKNKSLSKIILCVLCCLLVVLTIGSVAAKYYKQVELDDISLNITATVLTGIEITTPPEKILYYPGDDFDPTGMVVTASYSDNSTKEVTNYTIVNGENLSVGQVALTVSYREGDVSKTASTPITVSKYEGKIELSAASGTLTYPTSGNFTVKANTSGGELSVRSSDTDIANATINGTTVTVTPEANSGTATITVTSAETDSYNSASATYTVTVKKGTLSVSASGYTGTYDGETHSITVTCSGAAITYSEDGSSYSSAKPTYTNAGTYTVYYKVSKSGYTTATGYETVTINKADGKVELSSTSRTLTYPTNGSFTVKTNISGGELSVSTSNSSIATASISGTTVTVRSRTTAGTATITVTSAETDNYNAASATYTVTVKKGTLSVSASGYTGTYDGEAHSITVTCSGATIVYKSEDGSSYSSAKPTYTNAGTYTVYYRVSKSGYTTVSGYKTVTINKADGNVELSSSSGTLAYPESGSFTVKTNTSGGELSVRSSDTNIANATISGTTVTVTPEANSGTATITVTSAATTNYNAATAAYQVTVEYTIEEETTGLFYEDGSYVSWDDLVNNGDVVLSGTTITSFNLYYEDQGAYLVIPNSITAVGDYAFSSNDLLSRIKFEDNSQLTSIGNHAFDAVFSLMSIDFGKNSKLTSIGTGAFFSAFSCDLDIPDSVTYIGSNAFEDSGLTSVVIPSGVTEISPRSFFTSISLVSVTITENVTSIGNSAFCSCSALSDIYFTGTQAQWEAITFGPDWDLETGSYTIHYNYAG